MKDQNEDVEVRCEAAFALAKLEDIRAIAPFTFAAKDKNARVALYAEIALNRLQNIHEKHD